MKTTLAACHFWPGRKLKFDGRSNRAMVDMVAKTPDKNGGKGNMGPSVIVIDSHFKAKQAVY